MSAPSSSLPVGDEILVAIENLKTYFTARSALLSRTRAIVHAVEDVTFSIKRGEVVGLVGESGSGKTTLGHSILRLVEPTHGSVVFDGVDITRLPTKTLRNVRRKMQIIFQDPFSSLDPRMTVERIIGEPLKIQGLASGAERRDKVVELLQAVGLPPDSRRRYPHEFSGGQRQRIGIARTLAVEPNFIVADEPVSALDVSVQAQIINLLQDLRQTFGLTMLFIAHDIPVVEHISERIVVMYLGRVMEIGPSVALSVNPLHPYTRALLSATPTPSTKVKRERIILSGDIPSPIDPPSGCVFRTRCPHALAECSAVVPQLRTVAPQRQMACIRDDIA